MFTPSRPPTIAAAVLLFGLLGTVGACERENASHCGNLSGDATCAATDDASRPFCSVCEAAYDGCVLERPEPVCQRPEDAAGGSSSSGAASDGAASGTAMTASASGGSGSSDSGTTAGGATDSSGDAGSSSGGPVCGDGTIEGDLEKCEPGDPPDLDGESCESLGLIGGDLGCADDCRYDFSGCSSCGNDMIDGREECDMSDLGGTTECTAYNPDAYIGGSLGCRDNCTYDVNDCVLCVPPQGICETAADCCGSALCLLDHCTL